MASTNKKPAETIRSNGTKAAIWENTGKEGPFYTVTFVRSYKDAEGKWKNANSYGMNDLDDLSLVAFQAKLSIMKSK